MIFYFWYMTVTPIWKGELKVVSKIVYFIFYYFTLRVCYIIFKMINQSRSQFNFFPPLAQGWGAPSCKASPLPLTQDWGVALCKASYAGCINESLWCTIQNHRFDFKGALYRHVVLNLIQDWFSISWQNMHSSFRRRLFKGFVKGSWQDQILNSEMVA